jgi:serine/threonine protein kinase
MDPANLAKIAILVVAAVCVAIIGYMIRENAEFYRIFHVDPEPFENDIKKLFETNQNRELYYLQVLSDKYEHTEYYVYDRNMLLGMGQYANVYTGWNLKTKEKVAIKKFRHDCNKNEINILKRVNQFIGYTKNEYGRDHIILKYFPGIPYETLIRNNKLTQEELIYLFNLIISNLNEIHDFGVIHDDCHLHNILIEYHEDFDVHLDINENNNGNSSNHKICTDLQSKNKYDVAFVDFGRADSYDNHKSSGYYKLLKMKEILFLIDYTISVYSHYFGKYDQFRAYLDDYRWYMRSMISKSGY